MILDFSGKAAFVTGGSNGIGRACAARLAASGANVTVFDLESDPPGDVRDPASLRAAIAANPPDVTVVNAGMVAPAPLLEARDEAGNLGMYELAEPVTLHRQRPQGACERLSPARAAPHRCCNRRTILTCQQNPLRSRSNYFPGDIAG